jgi:hypothetical protein
VLFKFLLLLCFAAPFGCSLPCFFFFCWGFLVFLASFIALKKTKKKKNGKIWYVREMFIFPFNNSEDSEDLLTGWSHE